MEKHAAVHLGGAELQADLLARELSARRGVRVVYLARGVPPPDVAATCPYEIRCIGSGTGAFRKRAVFFDAPRLWRELRDIRPGAIYQRMKRSYTGICARYARHAGIPLFFHAAIDTDVSPDRRRGRRVANLPFDVIEAALANHGVRRATHLIVQTTRQAALARAGFGRSDATVVPNFQPLPEVLHEKSNARFCVLWVANIHANKRPELFLELASRMSGRDDIEFVMIGKPNPNWTYGRGMAEILEAPNVRYLGQLPLSVVNDWMDKADVFVNTSELEGFPNTFIQAWARGAVVLSRAVDIDGGLEGRGIGFRCPSMDSLVHAVDALAGSGELRQGTRERAFSYATENHSMKNASRLASMILASVA